MTSPTTAEQVNRGRVNQKARTRMAIVAAARALTETGADVNMPAIATRALVSEATAYRYFPDLVSLLSEALDGVWPSPAVALEPVAHSADPVERIGFATEFLLRGVLRYQGAVRAMIAGTITRPQSAGMRPGQRFALMDEALAPVADGLDAAVLERLKQDLAIVMSAEGLLVLTDLCGLSGDDAVAAAVRPARTITAAAVR
jgi:AcrR family transcriptional regulator